MNTKQLKSLIAASLFGGALLSGIAFADDKPMDPNMPMNNAAPAKPMDSSMPMDSKTATPPMKHKKHKKAMAKPMDKSMDTAKPTDKDMSKPADSDKMGKM
jgi:hypothetical protein